MYFYIFKKKSYDVLDKQAPKQISPNKKNKAFNLRLNLIAVER